jgi:putative hydrolase of the HAD superfamily
VFARSPIRKHGSNFTNTGDALEIKAVSLDFWNTLFTESAGGFRFYQERRRELLHEAISRVGEFSVEQIEEAFAFEFKSHNTIWIEEHRTLATGERVLRVLSHLDVALADEVTLRLTEAFEEGILERPPVLIEGVGETLERLASRYRLGIISDVGYSPGRVLRRVLSDAGIIHLFDSLIFSDEAGYSKPHRAVFEQTARSLKSRAEEIVHIGDLEHTDIIGAKRAGWSAIRFTGATPMLEGEETIADRVTDDFVRMPRIIEMLNSPSS